MGVVCCQVEIPASGSSRAQSSPTQCSRENEEALANYGLSRHEKKIIAYLDTLLFVSKRHSTFSLLHNTPLYFKTGTFVC
jgi:hypothetical protein